MDPLDVREKLIDYVRLQRDLNKVRRIDDLSLLTTIEKVVLDFTKEVERIMDRLSSSVVMEARWKFIAHTYLSIETIPLYKRIINIAKLYSEISAIQDGTDIIDIEEMFEKDDDAPTYDNGICDELILYGYTDLSVIPVITYENVMDAVSVYNKYFSLDLTVEDIFSDKEDVITEELLAYRIETDALDLYIKNACMNDDKESIRACITGKHILFVKDRYLIDTYVFGDHTRNPTLGEFRESISEIY